MKWTPKKDEMLRRAIEVAQPAIEMSKKAGGKFTRSDEWSMVAGALMASSPGVVVTGQSCLSRSKRLDSAVAKGKVSTCAFDISIHQSALEGMAVRMADLEGRMRVLQQGMETICTIVVDISNQPGRK
tara:strand:- start:190 stop:573 length:384 start_codon:yes stop_codon:yes gene_type:complete